MPSREVSHPSPLKTSNPDYYVYDLRAMAYLHIEYMVERRDTEHVTLRCQVSRYERPCLGFVNEYGEDTLILWDFRFVEVY